MSAKRCFILFSLAAACGGAEQPQKPTTPPAAPVATSPAPAPGPADPAPKTEGAVTEAWSHGIQVIVERVPGAEMVAAQLYVRGGVRNWGKADAGVEQLALATSAAGGTQRLDKDAFTRRLADLGSQIFAFAGDDFSWYSAKSLLPNWDATFDLLVDVFRRPALPASEIELQRQRQLSQLKHEQEEPDAKLDYLVHVTLFKGHPYENRAIGTLESVAGLDAAKLRAHLAKLREASRLVLVVVGDVDLAHVLSHVEKGLGDLPRGSYVETALPPWTVDKAAVFVTEQKLPTNYVTSLFPGPAWRDPEFPAARVAMSLLSEREFEEVRTKRNLSYAPGAFFDVGSALPRGGLYVSAVDPNATMKVMLDEARRLRTEPAPDKELIGVKSTFLTGYFVNNEATDGRARMLGEAQLRGGDWHLALTLPDRVRAVTAAQVQAFAAKYAVKMQTVVLGDGSKVDQTILTAP